MSLQYHPGQFIKLKWWVGQICDVATSGRAFELESIYYLASKTIARQWIATENAASLTELLPHDAIQYSETHDLAYLTDVLTDLDDLAARWQQAKGITDRLDVKQKREALQTLAEEMMACKLREISTVDALAIIKDVLGQMGVAESDMAGFLDDIQASSGLLVEKEADMWGFAHLTFQEYLCATHWKDTGKITDWNSAQWQKLIEDSWWHETLRLYAAQMDATILVNACLQLRTDAAIKLANDIAKEALKLDSAVRARVTTSLQQVVIRLRREPLIVSQEDLTTIFKLDKYERPLEYIQNDYEDRGEVVVDHATGLMWQKAGSPNYMIYKDAQAYIRELNTQQFAGYSDWRLPTIPELMSLLEPEKQANDLYINPIFDKTQFWCWSADRLPEDESSSGSAWGVIFDLGVVYWNNLNLSYYVRAVRS